MSSLESGKLVQCPFPEVLSVESPGCDPENSTNQFRRHMGENEAPWSLRFLWVSWSIQGLRDLFKEDVQSSVVPNCWCFCLGCNFFCWNWEGVRYTGPSKSHHSSTSSNLLILGRLHVLASKLFNKTITTQPPKLLLRSLIEGFEVDSRFQLVRSRLGFRMSENHDSLRARPSELNEFFNPPWWLSF